MVNVFRPTQVLDRDGDYWYQPGTDGCWTIDDMLVDYDGCGPHLSIEDLNQHHGPLRTVAVDNPEQLTLGVMNVIARCLRWIDVHDADRATAGEYALAAAAILGELFDIDITADRSMCGLSCAVHHRFTQNCKLRKLVEP